MQDYLVWNPNPIAFDFGIVRVSWYGLTWSASILLAYFIGRAIFARENKDSEKLTLLIQYVFLGAVIGARVFDVLFYHFDEFIARPLLMFEIMNGGLASHGAMIGVVIALFLFARFHPSFTFVWSLDKVALVMPILGALVRIGNFINSELYGKATDLPWAVVFPLSDAQNLPRHPVQLYESLWLFFCFALFWWLYKKDSRPPGFFVSMFLIVVLGGRLLIEFLKESSTYWGPLSNTQWLSLLGVLLGLGLFTVQQSKEGSKV
jgi:prolipoprotein diacylglyceryl transferase